MVILNFLRALVDLGFYYSIAGMFSAAAGGQLALEIFLLQGACFALSFSLRRGRAVRVAALLPALLPALLSARLPVPTADVLVSLPPVFYLAYLAWTDGYQLSRNRQTDLFNVFWRAFLVMAGLLTLVNQWQAALSVGIPSALIAAAASVLLMRSLRHEPSVYLQPGYQTANIAGIILLALAALVLGSEWVIRTAVLVVGAFYNWFIAPIFIGVAMLIGLVLSVLARLVFWIFSMLDPGESGDIAQSSEAGFQEQMDQLAESLPSLSVERVLQAIVAVIVIVTLILVFRWMSRRWNDQTDTTAPMRADIPGRRGGERARPGSYAYRIRRQYRTFLRLCQDNGLQFQISDTSTDVGRKSLSTFPDEAAMTGLRDIYQQARYQGEVSREDYQQFKKLLGALKKAQAGQEKTSG